MDEVQGLALTEAFQIHALNRFCTYSRDITNQHSCLAQPTTNIRCAAVIENHPTLSAYELTHWNDVRCWLAAYFLIQVLRIDVIMAHLEAMSGDR